MESVVANPWFENRPPTCTYQGRTLTPNGPSLTVYHPTLKLREVVPLPNYCHALAMINGELWGIFSSGLDPRPPYTMKRCGLKFG